MEDRLEQFFKEQMELNIKCNEDFKQIIETKDRELIRKWVINYTIALQCELSELIEGHYKWWKNKPEMTDEVIHNMKIEAVDCLHFLGGIFQVLGMDADEVWDLYLKKNRLNHKRQEEGYRDGSYSKIDEKGKEDNFYLKDEVFDRR